MRSDILRVADDRTGPSPGSGACPGVAIVAVSPPVPEVSLTPVPSKIRPLFVVPVNTRYAMFPTDSSLARHGASPNVSAA